MTEVREKIKKKTNKKNKNKTKSLFNITASLCTVDKEADILPKACNNYQFPSCGRSKMNEWYMALDRVCPG